MKGVNTLEIGSPAEERSLPAQSKFLELPRTQASLGAPGIGWQVVNRWGKVQVGCTRTHCPGGYWARGGCFLSCFLQRLVQEQVLGAGAKGSVSQGVCCYLMRHYRLDHGLVVDYTFSVWACLARESENPECCPRARSV